MGLKGTIQPGRIPRNKYTLSVVGLPPIDFIHVGGIDEEIEEQKLPDRTTASGGQKPTIEFAVRIPAHHDVAVAAMEAWYKEGQDPVSPTYKKAGTLTKPDIFGNVKRSYAITGAWCQKRSMNDIEFANEGEMDVLEYMIKADEITPIG